jgi:hypothetical protein
VDGKVADTSDSLMRCRLDLMFKKKIPARKFKGYEITHADRLEMEEVDRRV